ncbi:unnamed protein product [Arctogadus glacialis]
MSRRVCQPVGSGISLRLPQPSPHSQPQTTSALAPQPASQCVMVFCSIRTLFPGMLCVPKPSSPNTFSPPVLCALQLGSVDVSVDLTGSGRRGLRLSRVSVLENMDALQAGAPQRPDTRVALEGAWL